MPKKILFVTYKLHSYRIPIFNIIAESNDLELTVAHSAKKTNNSDNKFTEIILNYKKIGPFTLYNSSFNKLVKDFDVVVCMFYLQNLSFFKLALSRKRKFKLIFWGIGVRASYDSEFDAPTFFNKVRYFWAKRSNAMIFYTQYAKDKYIKHGFSANKLFVMHNTVEVNGFIEGKSTHKDLLFIGTLYKSKKIFELLKAYQEAQKHTQNLPKLQIVGKGDEYNNIQHWIESTDNTQNVFLHGAIYDESILAEMFTSSIACLSPGQAGLSVLKSFGYGVPFITHKNSITGGERLNITHGETGILFSEDAELSAILVDISENREKYLKMGKRAKHFYDTKRMPQNMANGFINAVQYTLQ